MTKIFAERRLAISEQPPWSLLFYLSSFLVRLLTGSWTKIRSPSAEFAQVFHWNFSERWSSTYPF